MLYWHFNIHEQDKFRAQLNWIWKKKFNNLGSLSVPSSLFWKSIWKQSFFAHHWISWFITFYGVYKKVTDILYSEADSEKWLELAKLTQRISPSVRRGYVIFHMWKYNFWNIHFIQLMFPERKTDVAAFEHQRRRPSYKSTQSDQCLCCSLPG